MQVTIGYYLLHNVQGTRIMFDYINIKYSTKVNNIIIQNSSFSTFLALTYYITFTEMWSYYMCNVERYNRNVQLKLYKRRKMAICIKFMGHESRLSKIQKNSLIERSYDVSSVCLICSISVYIIKVLLLQGCIIQFSILYHVVNGFSVILKQTFLVISEVRACSF